MNNEWYEDQQVSAVWTKPIKGMKERLGVVYAEQAEGLKPPQGSLVRTVMDKHNVTQERAEYLIEAFGG